DTGRSPTGKPGSGRRRAGSAAFPPAWPRWWPGGIRPWPPAGWIRRCGSGGSALPPCDHLPTAWPGARHRPATSLNPGGHGLLAWPPPLVVLVVAPLPPVELCPAAPHATPPVLDGIS